MNFIKLDIKFQLPRFSTGLEPTLAPRCFRPCVTVFPLLANHCYYVTNWQVRRVTPSIQRTSLSGCSASLRVPVFGKVQAKIFDPIVSRKRLTSNMQQEICTNKCMWVPIWFKLSAFGFVVRESLQASWRCLACLLIPSIANMVVL